MSLTNCTLEWNITDWKAFVRHSQPYNLVQTNLSWKNAGNCNCAILKRVCSFIFKHLWYTFSNVLSLGLQYSFLYVKNWMHPWKGHFMDSDTPRLTPMAKAAKRWKFTFWQTRLGINLGVSESIKCPFHESTKIIT